MINDVNKMRMKLVRYLQISGNSFYAKYLNLLIIDIHSILISPSILVAANSFLQIRHMQNDRNQTCRQISAYKDKGFSLRQDQADDKIRKIQELNQRNNSFITKLKLGRLKIQNYSFPDKFSPDLADITLTCEIESMLIDHIKELQNQIDFTVNELNLIVNKFNLSNNELSNELSKTKKSLAEEKTKKEQLENKINSMQEKIAESKKLAKQNQQLKKYVKGLSAELTIERNKKSVIEEKLLDSQKREMQIKSRYPIKNLEMVKPIEPVKIANTMHKIQETRSALEEFQQFISSNYEERLKCLDGENRKLRDWLQRFIESVERILKLKLQKLRQNPLMQQQIYTHYKHLGKMHLNIVKFSTTEEFPYDEMLADFYFIVSRADQNQLQLDQLRSLNKTKTLDKELVTAAIDALRKFNSAIINEFAIVGQKRKQIAEEYKKIVRPQLPAIEWLEQFKVQDLLNFIDRPSKLINEVEREYQAVKKYKQQLKKNLEYAEPAFKQRFQNLESDTQRYLKNLNNKNPKEGGFERVEPLKPFNGVQRIRTTEDLLEQIEQSQDERELRQKQKMIMVNTEILDKKYSSVPFAEEKKLMKEQVMQGRSPLQVKQEYIRFMQRGENYVRENLPHSDQPNWSHQPHVQNENIFCTRKKQKNQNQDIEI